MDPNKINRENLSEDESLPVDEEQAFNFDEIFEELNRSNPIEDSSISDDPKIEIDQSVFGDDQEASVNESESREDHVLPDIRSVMDQKISGLEDGMVLDDEHIDQNIPIPDIRLMEVRRVGSDDEADQSVDKKTPSFLYSVLDTLKFIFLGLIIGMLLIIFVIQRNTVYGESMHPTLSHRDAVFVEMISVYFNNINRGDIVALDAEGMSGYMGSEKIIKRVIGLPGETVSIIEGYIYINGEQIDEPYLPEGLLTYVPMDGINNGYHDITLGPDEYFCLGDNRGASNDSRRLGPFNRNQIKSKVIIKVYPFDDIRVMFIAPPEVE